MLLARAVGALDILAKTSKSIYNIDGLRESIGSSDPFIESSRRGYRRLSKNRELLILPTTPAFHPSGCYYHL